MSQKPQHLAAFESRDDLKKYKHNALLLYALEMRFQLQDIDSVASLSLTDSNDDKKCDLIHVDEEAGEIVVAQGYISANAEKISAPSNKASDLNTAVAWLLGCETENLPIGLRSAAAEVKAALQDKQIRSVQFWYVHNLPESKNVKLELKTVERSAERALRQLLPGQSIPEVVAIEVGTQTLDEWYNSLQTPILVDAELEVEVPGGYRIEAENWSAFATSMPAEWLYQVYKQHKSNLFSANVRGYLGSRRSSSNINNAIKVTADEKAGHFWVYNNGLTVLVHDFNATQIDKTGKLKLKISGFSIVNGAQTTGAIGSLDQPPGPAAMVQVRIVKCTDFETLHEIIRNNNSQNRIETTDFRSRDPVQERLRKEFKVIPAATYTGGRRGGHEDIIRRPADLLPAETCGQALAAFHGKPETAYHEKSEIWHSNKLYGQYFSELTSAQHIVFAYGLLRAVEATKQSLVRNRPQPQN